MSHSDRKLGGIIFGYKIQFFTMKHLNNTYNFF